MTAFAGITRLVAEGFRGATSRFELRLLPEQPFVLLFGENGSGKSTVVDAIEFALEGTKGSLGDFKSTSPRHLASLGTRAAPLRVELEAGGRRWAGSLDDSQPRLEGPETRPRVEILRRSRLAKIVAATPAERFEQLDRFVNVDGVAASEAGLERAAKDAKQRLQEASRDIADTESALRALWDESGRPAGDPILWARKVAAAQAEADASKASPYLDGEPSPSAESGAEALIELLAAARKMLAAASNEDACPLCRHPVDLGQLRAGIETHLRASEAGLARLTESANARAAENERSAHIARLSKQHDLARQQVKAIESESDRLARCHKIVRAMRQKFTDDILQEVAGEVNRLYREIHPNEPELGGARFYLDPKQRASLHQAVKFGQADDLPPQACFSESHLLTLAFCLWLALAKRERPAETILVLDDVVHAIDAPHMQRIAALLAAERKHFLQVIVTTHSRRFLRYLRDGIAPSGRLDCRILRWSLRGGIVQAPSLHTAEQLEKALAQASPDRKTIITKSGALLEAVLRQLAVLYRRPVPFAEPPEPTLLELFDAWSPRDTQRVTIERSNSSAGTLEDILGKLHGLPHLRNLLGAPTSTEAGEVPDREAQEFGRRVLDLWRLMVCACGQIPNKEKDGGFVCHCGQTRIRPERLAPPSVTGFT